MAVHTGSANTAEDGDGVQEPPDTGGAAAARAGDRHKLTALQGLAALSLDAMASVAYGPESIVLVLAVAGAYGMGFTLPVTLAIAGLLAVLVASYRQVIAAFPDGGGSYAVAKWHLGRRTSLVAMRLSDPRLRAERRGLRHRRCRRSHLGLPSALRRTDLDLPRRPPPGHGHQPARRGRLGQGVPAADRPLRRLDPRDDRGRALPQRPGQHRFGRRSHFRARRQCHHRRGPAPAQGVRGRIAPPSPEWRPWPTRCRPSAPRPPDAPSAPRWRSALSSA